MTETLAINTKITKTRPKSTPRLAREQRIHDQTMEWAESVGEVAKGIYFLGRLSIEGVKIARDRIMGIEKPKPDYRRKAMNMMASELAGVSVEEVLMDNDEAFLGDIHQVEIPNAA